MAFLFLIFIAIIGALFCGDSSLLIAILKFVGGALLVLGIMAMVAYCPWLLLVVIAVAIFVVWACSNNTSQSNNTNNINNISNINNSNTSLNNTNTQPVQKNIEKKLINNPNLTGFKAELQENTLTPQQASDEQWETDKRCIDYEVDRAYENIKSNLLRQARKGDYSVSNGQRRMTYTYEYTPTYSFFKRQDIKNPTGEIFTRSYNPHERVVYSITDTRKYNYLVRTLKDKAKQDGIDIDVYFVLCERNDKRRISLPYTDSENFCYIRSAKMYVDCSIQY